MPGMFRPSLSKERVGERVKNFLVRQQERFDRQAKVKDYWIQGYGIKEMSKLVGCPEREVKSHLGVIQNRLLKQSQQATEYRRNKLLHKLTLLQKTLWETINKTKNERIIKACSSTMVEIYALEAKIEGVTEEKMPSMIDKRADSLISEVLAIEKTAKGNGHKTVEKDKDLTTVTKILEGNDAK